MFDHKQRSDIQFDVVNDGRADASKKAQMYAFNWGKKLRSQSLNGNKVSI